MPAWTTEHSAYECHRDKHRVLLKVIKCESWAYLSIVGNCLCSCCFLIRRGLLLLHLCLSHGCCSFVSLNLDHHRLHLDRSLLQNWLQILQLLLHHLHSPCSPWYSLKQANRTVKQTLGEHVRKNRVNQGKQNTIPQCSLKTAA